MVKVCLQLARGLALALLLSCPAIATAASITEVFFASPVPGVGLSPDAVELNLAGLTRPTVDLVILDAADTFAARVRQVVTIPTSHPTLLICETAWPTGLWALPTESPDCVTLADLGAGSSWLFTGSRTIILFDRETDLVANLLPLSQQTAALNGAVALDWVTFRRSAAATSAWNGEPVVDVGAAAALSRPFDPATDDFGSPWVGSPDAAGYFPASGQAYRVTPGIANAPLVAHHPEPTTGALIAAVALFYAHRRPIMDGYAR